MAIRALGLTRRGGVRRHHTASGRPRPRRWDAAGATTALSAVAHVPQPVRAAWSEKRRSRTLNNHEKHTEGECEGGTQPPSHLVTVRGGHFFNVGTLVLVYTERLRPARGGLTAAGHHTSQNETQPVFPSTPDGIGAGALGAGNRAGRWLAPMEEGGGKRSATAPKRAPRQPKNKVITY